MSINNTECRLILFDMDGTLVMLADHYMGAYPAAIRAVYGIEPDFHDDGAHSGNTQPNIIRAICRQLGLDAAVIDSRLGNAVATLAALVVRSLPDDLRPCVLPGVRCVLAALREQGHALALVSGTVGPLVRVILDRTALQGYFPVCACGDEADDRVALLNLAIERATQVYGLSPGAGRLSVVGDAPRDIQAGKEVGARVIAVATGFHRRELLAEYHPDVLLPGLEDWQTAAAAIVSCG